MTISAITEQDPTWAEVVAAYAEAGLDRRDGSIVALVVSYDSATQVAQVRPPVPIVRNGESVGQPVFRVRVAWPRNAAGTFADTFPLATGDPLILRALDYDHSGWFASRSQDVAPPGRHRSSFNDAVAVPGGASEADPLPAAALAADGRVIYGTPFVYLGSALATDFVALAQLVLTELGKAKADRDAMKAAFDTHGHTETGAITSQPIASPTPGGVPVTFPVNTSPSSVASTVVKSV